MANASHNPRAWLGFSKIPPNTRPFCPRCGNLDVRPSQHALPLVSLFGLQTWRCRACRRRFLVGKLVEEEERA